MLLSLAPLAAAFVVGCGGTAPEATSGESAEALTACPSPDATDAQERVVATLAFDLMKGAGATGGPVAPVFSNTILAAQRYRIQSGGVGIEFDPNDPLYKYVTNPMKAALQFAQLDSTVAKFLSDGLTYAYNNSDGWYFPSIDSVQVLANYRFGSTNTIHLADNTSQNNSHQASVDKGSPWCGAEMVTITDSVQQSYTFSPLYALKVTNPDVIIAGNWLNNPPATFHGTSARPQTPFNGPGGNGNPYLVVSVNGTASKWSNYNFTAINCWNLPQPWQCTGTIQIDPVPYAEPGSYYDTSGNLIGTQANPFTIVGTLYATPDHQSQWATRTVNGVQEWGMFSTPVTLLGVTEYKYVKRM